MSIKSGELENRRVVFDTNILISAYLWPGTPRKALEIVKSGTWQLFSSISAIKEFVRVLGYSKFGFSTHEIVPLIKDLETFVTYVTPRKGIEVITSDPTDNLFLGIASQAKCSYLVSGDKHLLNVREFEGIQIITVAKFISLATKDDPHT